MKISGCALGPLTANDTDLDFDAFTLELEDCESSGTTDANLVVFTGPPRSIPTSSLNTYYGLCSADPIALTVVPTGLSVGDTCGV